MQSIIKEILDAHGGADYWRSLEAIEAEISAWGFLFKAKRVPVLNRVWVRALTREPRFTFFDSPQPGQTIELFGDKEVCILDSNGKAEERRFNPNLFWLVDGYKQDPECFIPNKGTNGLFQKR
jgi:hypothetical protein